MKSGCSKNSIPSRKLTYPLQSLHFWWWFNLFPNQQNISLTKPPQQGPNPWPPKTKSHGFLPIFTPRIWFWSSLHSLQLPSMRFFRCIGISSTWHWWFWWIREPPCLFSKKNTRIAKVGRVCLADFVDFVLFERQNREKTYNINWYVHVFWVSKISMYSYPCVFIYACIQIFTLHFQNLKFMWSKTEMIYNDI